VIERRRAAILLTDRLLRDRFHGDLNGPAEAAPVTIFAAVFDKLGLRTRYADTRNPYRVALHFCMERLHVMLSMEGQHGRTVHVIFESRGRKEDRKLELEFRRIAANDSGSGRGRRDFSLFEFQPVFVPKAANSVGLQLADLTARPIALSHLRPDQPSRAFEIVRPKIGGLAKFPWAAEAGKSKRAPKAPGPLCRPGNFQSSGRYIAAGPSTRKRIRPAGNRSVVPGSCRTEGVTLAGEIEESPTVASVHEMSLSESPRPDGTSMDAPSDASTVSVGLGECGQVLSSIRP